MFLKQYWGTGIQQKIRRQIDTQRYSQEGNMLRVEYFVKMVGKALYLNPPIPEDDLVRKIMRHFGHKINMISLDWTKRNIKETIEFLNVLEEEGIKLHEYTVPNKDYRRQDRYVATQGLNQQRDNYKGPQTPTRPTNSTSYGIHPEKPKNQQPSKPCPTHPKVPNQGLPKN